MSYVPPPSSQYDAMQQLRQTTSTRSGSAAGILFTEVVNLLDLNCYLTRTMINEPGTLICGHSFEESQIKNWYDKKKKSVICPLCKQESSTIGKNIFLKSILDRWKFLNLQTAENQNEGEEVTLSKPEKNRKKRIRKRYLPNN
jgi:hypothetical protein